jgi:excisionase family DNA binding protein
VADRTVIAPAVMTVNELAAYLAVHSSTVYRLIRRKTLPCFKIGSDYRFTKAAIDEWMTRASQPQPPASRRRIS